MRDIIRIQTKVEGDKDYKAEVKCPYCGKATIVNPVMTESGCIHFDDYEELFALHYDEESEDRVEVIEFTFLQAGSKSPGITRHVSGELVETDEGWKVVVDGKTEAIMTEDEFINSMFGDGI